MIFLKTRHGGVILGVDAEEEFVFGIIEREESRKIGAQGGLRPDQGLEDGDSRVRRWGFGGAERPVPVDEAKPG